MHKQGQVQGSWQYGTEDIGAILAARGILLLTVCFDIIMRGNWFISPMGDEGILKNQVLIGNCEFDWKPEAVGLKLWGVTTSKTCIILQNPSRNNCCESYFYASVFILISLVCFINF